MKKILLLNTVLVAIFLLVACTNTEQKAYEEALQEAKDKISAGEYAEAQELLTKSVATGYEETDEAKNLLEQLKEYQMLEDLLKTGNFEGIYKSVENITQIKDGSTIISTKAQVVKKTAEQEQQRLNTILAKVEESLKLAEAKKYDEANVQLKALDLTDYEASYYVPIKAIITETIASNDRQIAAIKEEEQRKAQEAIEKAEAEEKARAEETRKSNMLNWTYEEIQQYIANYFGMNSNYVIVEVYDRTDSGYSIEARQDNAALGKGDPGVAPALGFFEVRADGKLYKMDIVSGDYIMIN